MSFLYRSTRGIAPLLDFRGVTMTGLAADGGLYVPQQVPHFSAAEIAALRGQPYLEIAFRVLQPFVAGVLDEAVLRSLLAKAYAGFADPAITPLRPLDDNLALLELFHGPTLAFKDVALQLLGQLFEHFLESSGARMTVLGATSGDTGSAAILALANRKNIDTVILYPHNRPSDIQRKQMTCVDAPNVQAVAVEGSFDDCQALVKALFNDPEARKTYNLAAVNSINWARIVAQVVYYFVAAVQMGAPEKPVNFVVPTGNFGNVYAAYVAKQCGLPIAKLVLATNRNDILARFAATGRMEPGEVAATLSPSMDIQISSNFERLLLELCGGDTAEVRAKMEHMQTTGRFEVTPAQKAVFDRDFIGVSQDDTQTITTIRAIYERTGVVLDPHTAVGVGAALRLKEKLTGPVIALGCAHPAKFPEVIQRAINLNPPVPATVAAWLRKPERKLIISPDIQAVKDILSSRISGRNERYDAGNYDTR